jgi:hypothetical protein
MVAADPQCHLAAVYQIGPGALRNAAVASLPAALDREVERMAEAMAANPIYRITNRETAMAYFRANALTRLTAQRRL